MFKPLLLTLLLLAPIAQAITPPAPSGPDGVATVATFERPENVLATSSGRTFVSGGKGLYELVLNADGSRTTVPVSVRYKTAVGLPLAVPKDNTPCGFLGLAESKGYLYALCTPNMLLSYSPKYLLAMNLSGPTQMQELTTLQNVSLPNGMAADSVGRLYFADSGPSIPGIGGKIVRVTLSSATSVAAISGWLTPALKPNGVRIHKDTLYYSENPKDLLSRTSYLRKLPIKADGTAGAITTVASYNNYLDDFMLATGWHYYSTDANGNTIITSDQYVIAAAYNEGVLKSINETKGSISNFGPYSFKNPTSIAPASGGWNFLITEAGAHQVTLMHLGGTLLPRR